MQKRWIVWALVASMLAAPAAADARTVRYEGQGVEAKGMDVSFFLRERRALKRLSFDRIPMRCDGGRRYETGGRRFGDPIRLKERNRFRARGRGRVGNGTVEVARVRGRVRPRRGRAHGVLQVRARHKSGAVCRSGEQRFRTRAA